MNARVVDLRSDTVTLPTDKMRLALQQAEVGDSLKDEDPSVNRLQKLGATILGKEAALFLPSATMSNLAAIMAHCRHGDRAVVGQGSHIMQGERDGITRLAGVMPTAVPDSKGVPDPRDVERAITPRKSGRPYTSLVCLENTHNAAGGAAVPAASIGVVAAIARMHEIPVHLDGARLFNAAVALGVDASQLVREVDSVTLCLSKGLSAPMGALLIGSNEFIREAGFVRRILGGGMRQVGHMAAAGIVALEDMVDRLGEDHQNARHLAELLAGLPILRADPSRVQTNIVLLEIDQEKMSRERFVSALYSRGVKTIPFRGTYVRLTTHRGITRDDVEYAALVIKEVVVDCSE